MSSLLPCYAKKMLGKRLAESRKRAGLMQVELAVALGARYDQTVVSAVEHNRSSLRLDGLARAAQALGVSSDYLLGLTNDPTPSAELSAAKDPADNEALATCGHGFRPLAVRDTAAAGGWGAEVNGEPVIGHLAFREDWLSKQGINVEKASIIDVLGDSMEPTLQEGAAILVDHQRVRRLDNRIFVVRTEDGVIVKRLAKKGEEWQLVSDNRAYKPLPFPRDGKVIGQVRWTGRTL